MPMRVFDVSKMHLLSVYLADKFYYQLYKKIKNNELMKIMIPLSLALE